MFNNQYIRGGYCHHPKEKVNTMTDMSNCCMTEPHTMNMEHMNMVMPNNHCHQYQTTYQEYNPIYTTSKQIVNQYHVAKQPYIHNHHTEVVHHQVLQNEYIPTYSCSEVYVNDCGCGMPRKCC